MQEYKFKLKNYKYELKVSLIFSIFFMIVYTSWGYIFFNKSILALCLSFLVTFVISFFSSFIYILASHKKKVKKFKDIH